MARMVRAAVRSAQLTPSTHRDLPLIHLIGKDSGCRVPALTEIRIPSASFLASTCSNGPMFRILHQNRILAAILGGVATSLFAVLIAAGAAHAARTSFYTHLLSLADDAALAAAATLGPTAGQPEPDRRETAMIAAQEEIAARVVQSRIEISIEALRVVVALTAERPGLFGRYLGGLPETIGVVSHAEYVPPDQPSNWSWTSRQYFTGQRHSVLIRSSCSAAACGTEKAE
jgi:hypothetical protein